MTGQVLSQVIPEPSPSQEAALPVPPCSEQPARSSRLFGALLPRSCKQPDFNVNHRVGRLGLREEMKANHEVLPQPRVTTCALYYLQSGHRRAQSAPRRSGWRIGGPTAAHVVAELAVRLVASARPGNCGRPVNGSGGTEMADRGGLNGGPERRHVAANGWAGARSSGGASRTVSYGPLSIILFRNIC